MELKVEIHNLSQRVTESKTVASFQNRFFIQNFSRKKVFKRRNQKYSVDNRSDQDSTR